MTYLCIHTITNVICIRNSTFNRISDPGYVLYLPLLGTLEPSPPTSSSAVNFSDTCGLKQGCNTLTGTPSTSLRKKKHVVEKTKHCVEGNLKRVNVTDCVLLYLRTLR